MKNFIKTLTALTFILSFTVLTMNAKVKIVDNVTGEPLVKASVFDKNGKFIAITDDYGIVPSSVTVKSYPLNIRYVGYEPKEVLSPNEEIVKLEETSYDLPEVMIDAENRNLLWIKAYIRNYATRTTVEDTIMVFEEKIVDFVFPMSKKAKFKGWKKPRVLSTRRYDWVSDGKRDTVLYKEGYDGKNYSYHLTDKFVLPEAMALGTSTFEIVPGKYSDKETWRKRGDTYFLELDGLADYKNHLKKPTVAKVLGFTMEMDQDDMTYKFIDNGKGEFSPEDILEATVVYHINLSGKAIKFAYETKSDMDINGYGELFVIDRAYLTANEAKELKKDAPVIQLDFEDPENIPLPPAQIIQLKERAKRENPNAK
ncbi:MAG: hypothetical protein J1E99_02520 [Muribaculaceae bacterium]|nr:hypothetical protein [Muribaculaceae bacterium]